MPEVRGKGEIRERHIARFQEPSLYGERIKRMVVENLVIDQEVVTRNFPHGREEHALISACSRKFCRMLLGNTIIPDSHLGNKGT
ncbi:hypothetical protein [Serratia silvae]|uniref:hypothetical protein n=1 Tax=Serratia silvae TaxID=2824122 RepID=UPI00200E590D|nr:hypothetical protein [Serratia silvae]